MKLKQKWDVKNPIQARQMAEKIWKKMGIYEELKNENNPEIINQKVTTKYLSMNKEQKQEVGKKFFKLLKKHAPSLLDELEKRFPWHLRYYWVILIVISVIVSGIGFLIGYFLEPVRIEGEL